MCGRFNFTDEQEEEIKQIVRDVTRRFGERAVPKGDLAPTEEAVILERGRSAGDAAEVNIMPWGFPKWDGKGVVFNARAETVTERSMFRPSFQHRRCVIPCNGFYEWSKTDGGKEKHFLRHVQGGAMFMAGIARPDAFTILTTAANESMAAIHSRMPVLLRPSEIPRWLREEAFAREVAARVGYGVLTG